VLVQILAFLFASMVKAEINQQPASSSSSSTIKRKKFDDDEQNGNKKKPRTRVSYSCGECHRRKQKVRHPSFPSFTMLILLTFSVIDKCPALM